MTSCSFASDPAGCLKERDRRFKSSQPSHPWRSNSCENCKTGRAHAEAHIPPEPDEEETVPEKMTTKEKVLAAVGRRDSASPSILMQVSKASADALKVIVGELEREGKIAAWPYRTRQGMTALYTVPDAKDPRTKEMVEGSRPAPEKKAPPAARAVTAAPVAKPAPKNGSGVYAAAIAGLEAERTKVLDRVEQIDTAIATLRALA